MLPSVGRREFQRLFAAVLERTERFVQATLNTQSVDRRQAILSQPLRRVRLLPVCDERSALTEKACKQNPDPQGENRCRSIAQRRGPRLAPSSWRILNDSHVPSDPNLKQRLPGFQVRGRPAQLWTCLPHAELNPVFCKRPPDGPAWPANGPSPCIPLRIPQECSARTINCRRRMEPTRRSGPSAPVTAPAIGRRLASSRATS